MISLILSRLIILTFGVLYPAYASYKAVRTKDVKKYVQWMMYWIVFAFFTCLETFTDIFLSWFPFYYEVKVVIVIWLLSPATRGSATLYRRFVHPCLTKRENDIDGYLVQAKERGYSTVMQLGTSGLNFATSFVMQTALKGGGSLVQQLRKSYSLSDLSQTDGMEQMMIEEDAVDHRIMRHRSKAPRQGGSPRPNTMRSISSSGSGANVHNHYDSLDEDSMVMEVSGRKLRSRDVNFVRSNEDISSSGYSTVDNRLDEGLVRTSSQTSGRTKTRSKQRKVDKEVVGAGTRSPRVTRKTEKTLKNTQIKMS